MVRIHDASKTRTSTMSEKLFELGDIRDTSGPVCTTEMSRISRGDRQFVAFAVSYDIKPSIFLVNLCKPTFLKLSINGHGVEDSIGHFRLVFLSNIWDEVSQKTLLDILFNEKLRSKSKSSS